MVRRHGKGTYVAEQHTADSPVRLTDFMQDMALAGLVPSSRVLRLARERANRILAEALQVAPETEVVRVDRLRLANERPIAIDTTWLPLRYGVLLTDTDLAEQPIYRLLENIYGVVIASNTFHISAVSATAEQANLLDIAVGAAVLLIQRLSTTLHGEPVYMQERYYLPERVCYRATLQRPDPAIPGGLVLQDLRPVFRDYPNR